MAWKLSNANGKQWLWCPECERQVWCFCTMWAELVPPSWKQRRQKSYGQLSHEDCQAVREKPKPSDFRFFFCTSAFKIRWLKNEVMHLITDLSKNRTPYSNSRYTRLTEKDALTSVFLLKIKWLLWMKMLGRCRMITEEVRDQGNAVIYFCHIDLTATECSAIFLTISNLQQLPCICVSVYMVSSWPLVSVR